MCLCVCACEETRGNEPRRRGQLVEKRVTAPPHLPSPPTGTRLSRRAFKEVSGYVRQADYLNGEDTVAEAVGFSAFLRSCGDSEAREALVASTLEALGL